MREDTVDNPHALASLPHFSGSSISMSTTGNDLTIILSRNIPSLGIETASQPLVAITVPRGTAIDMQALLGDMLGAIEKDFGPVDTPYQKERREGKK